MTKEIDENKVEISLEIFQNIRKMIKSSNEEDFFIAIEMWRYMEPSNLLSKLLVKSTYLETRQKLENALGIASEHTWSVLWTKIDKTTLSDVEKDIITHMLEEHVKNMLSLQGMNNIGAKLNINITWEN